MSTEKMRQEASRFRNKEEKKDFFWTVAIAVLVGIVIAVSNLIHF